ncbi:FHA domain-containing protein [Dyella sp.]|uniref:FHA domain-containing protein n=1 Tax=Dyella sp. TaxID=1869338 RepID=UPI002ED46C68
MRIEFPNSSREDFPWTQATLRVGSAPDNDLVLAAGQAQPYHLRMQRDRRGIVLQVLAQAGRIYVNARPIRERALLRAGDILSVGDCRMLLREEESPAGRETPTIVDEDRCTASLRAVAGPLSGRVLSLRERVELGQGGRFPLDLPQGEVATLRIAWQNGKLWLEAGQRSERYPLRINGVEVNQAALQPGDQIGIAMHRFVVDAPGMEDEPEIPPYIPPRDHLPEEEAGPRGEVWWLIVTAAVIALIIALVLFVKF